MQNPENVNKVIDALDAADPDEEDEALQGMRNALRWVADHEPKSTEEFIKFYVDEL